MLSACLPTCVTVGHSTTSVFRCPQMACSICVFVCMAKEIIYVYIKMNLRGKQTISKHEYRWTLSVVTTGQGHSYRHTTSSHLIENHESEPMSLHDP